MKLKNGPSLCPYCGYFSVYCEIDRLSAIRNKKPDDNEKDNWQELLAVNQKKSFCLMCHKSIALNEDDQ